MTSMTWEAAQHPRATDGTFSEKRGTAPEVSLSPPTPSAQNVEPEDTIEELFGRVMWRSDGSFVGNFEDRAYAVLATLGAVHVVDDEGRTLHEDEPMHQAVRISLGRFDNELPVPPAPVRLDRADGRVTQLGALYDGWERADVVATRVENRISEAVAAGDLPPFEYEVRTENVGAPNQKVELRIAAPAEQLHGPDGNWTQAASVAYHSASHIVDAWNRRTEGGWAEPERTYNGVIHIYTSVG